MKKPCLRKIALSASIVIILTNSQAQAEEFYTCKIKHVYGVDKAGQIDDFSELLFGNEEVKISRDSGDINSGDYPISPKKTNVISRGNRDEMFIAVGTIYNKESKRRDASADAILVQIAQYVRSEEKPMSISSTSSSYKIATGTCIIEHKAPTNND